MTKSKNVPGIEEFEINLDPAHVRALIDDADWTPTDYIQPHEYVKVWEYPELYYTLKQLIGMYGYKRWFLYRQWDQIDIDGYEYWQAGGGIQNRRKLDRDATPNKWSGGPDNG